MTANGTGRILEVLTPGAAGERDAAMAAIESAMAELAQGFARLLAAELSLRTAQILQAAPAQARQGGQAAAVASMDVEAAMEFLGISKDTLYKLIKSQAVRSFKIGGRRFFRPADLEAFRDSRAEARW